MAVCAAATSDLTTLDRIEPLSGAMLSEGPIHHNGTGDPKMSTSSEPMFVSLSDIEELTGHARASIQMRWLRSRTIPFIVGGDGHPKVARQTLIGRIESLEGDAPMADLVVPKLAEITDSWDKVTEELMAEMMGLTARALQGRRARGVIPGSVWQEVGGRIMYSMRRYEAWLDARWPPFELPAESDPGKRAKPMKNNGKGPIHWIV